MTEPMVAPWLIDAVRQRAHEFASQLQTGVDGSGSIANLNWNVTDLAQHVAGLPSFWRDQHQSGATFDRPADFAAFSDQARAHITETDPRALAKLVTTEFEWFLDDLAASAEQRWLYGRPTNPSNMCGLALNELILHGRDLAQTTGAQPPMFERDEANAAVAAMMVTTPAFVDAEKAAAQPDGNYHVRFLGGKDYTWSKIGTELTITEGRPERPDARLRADPAMFLLSALGRIGQVRAGLSGKMIAYGKRPWRFIGLGAIAIDGV